MNIILHRCNLVSNLIKVNKKYGLEIDIRSYDNELILHHDPFKQGDKFKDWIKEYCHGTLILNVKEEGLEEKIISFLKKRNIEDYFFLDQSFPFLFKYFSIGEKRCAVRFSEFESINTVLNLSGKINWVWVDCFSKFPLSSIDNTRLKNLGFKICIVSPELQKRDSEKEISNFAKMIKELNIIPEAVCTKRPDIWEKIFI